MRVVHLHQTHNRSAFYRSGVDELMLIKSYSLGIRSKCRLCEELHPNYAEDWLRRLCVLKLVKVAFGSRIALKHNDADFCSAQRSRNSLYVGSIANSVFTCLYWQARADRLL